MSIIARNPVTRHQVSQLKAKAARQASKPVTAKVVDRVFGAGIFAPVAPVVHSPAPMVDCGEFSPSARSNARPSDRISDTDRAWWAAESASMEAKRLAAEIMAEFRQTEERADVMADILINDISWAEREATEARRFDSYRF